MNKELRARLQSARADIAAVRDAEQERLDKLPASIHCERADKMQDIIDDLGIIVKAIDEVLS